MILAWASPFKVYCYFMTLLGISSCSFGFIQDFLDHYTLERQKAVSAYLYSEQILPLALRGSRPIIGTNVG